MHKLTFTLLVIGGLNWLLFAITGYDVSRWLGGQDSMVSQVVYWLVGLSAVYEVVTHKNRCKECGM